MSTLLEQIAAAKAANAIADQTEAQKGFVRKVTPEGTTTARLISYVEIGKQPQRAFQGEAKADALEARLTFELNGQAYMRDVSKEGEPAKMVPTLYTETITISMNEKAKFFKLFIKMRGAQKVTHMAELVGQGFIVTIKHKKSQDGKKTYANIYNPVDGWRVSPPVETSAATGLTTEVPVPECDGDIQVLLQAAPSIEQWNSIFIDGEREIKNGDVTTKVSKNFVQFKCLAASDFKGSALEALLKAEGILTVLQAAAKIADDAYLAGKPADKPAEKAVDTNKSVPETMDAPAEETAPERVTEAIPQEETPAEEVKEETPAETPSDEAAVNPLEALGLT